MDHREPHELSIVEAGAALRDGSLTAAALTESVLSQVEATEPLLNAYITVTAELAREQASAADDAMRDGRDLGPLHGIPVALKDLVDTAGIATTGGGGFLRDRIPDSDAVVYTKLKEAGAVMPGKLNLHEFAFGTTSRNPHYGAVSNPWDVSRTPGGSSGGSGASVAVGSSLGALGSDTGGSIRIPASLCGVTGLMGTYGRVSRRGVLPLSWTLDHVGPLTKTVEDAGLVLNAIAGYDPHDPGSADVPVGDCTETLVEGVDGIRIGIPRKMLWQGCEEDVIEHCEIAVDHLRSMGATVTEVEMPLQEGRPRGLTIIAEAAAYHAKWLKERRDEYGDILERVEAGLAVSAVDYINDQRLRRKFIDETVAVLQDVDVLISPTCSRTAPLIEDGDPTAELARLTAPYDVTGIPAISIPCGYDRNGMPIGLMIGGRHFDEATVCRVAHAYEQSTDWIMQRPELEL